MSAVAKEAHLWDRSAQEWYVEPSSVTTQLLSREEFTQPIWDPACGGGNIVRACLAAGLLAFGTDIVNRIGGPSPWFNGLADFLATEPSDYLGADIICNPPFARGVMTEAFIRHALKRLSLKKLAVFTEIKFLTSARRANGLYAELPPSRVWMLSPRPSCPPGAYIAAGNKPQGGTADFCWIVWDSATEGGQTSLGWLRAGG